MRAIDQLRPLHEHGVKVSIDDFGTGYTSFAALPHLPLDEIKVDMSFVQRSLVSKTDEAIVRSIRDLAHRLGLTSVAEGVESSALETLMTEIGLDLLQGANITMPLKEDTLLDFLRRYPDERATSADASAEEIRPRRRQPTTPALTASWRPKSARGGPSGPGDSVGWSARVPPHGNCSERPSRVRSDRPGRPRHRGGKRHRPHHSRGPGRRAPRSSAPTSTPRAPQRRHAPSWASG